MNRVEKKLFTAVVIVCGYLFFGAIFFHIVEGWSYFDSFYFTAITLTTVGYGDLLPTHVLSKLFSIFLAFSGIGLVFYSVSIVAQHYFEREVHTRMHNMMHTATTFVKEEEHEFAHFLHGLGIHHMEKKGHKKLR